MYFRMHNWEEWLHVQQMSQFRAGLANFYQVWPVFTHDVSTKESCIFCAELFLQIQRICIDLSSEHIECLQKNTMPTDSDFNSLLIQFTAGLPGKLFSSCKLRRSTNTFASHLHEIQDNKVGKNRHLGYKERTQKPDSWTVYTWLHMWNHCITELFTNTWIIMCTCKQSES